MFESSEKMKTAIQIGFTLPDGTAALKVVETPGSAGSTAWPMKKAAVFKP